MTNTRAFTNKELFAGVAPRDDMTIVCTHNMITNMHWAIGRLHPRFAATYKKLNPNELDTVKWSGPASKFKVGFMAEAPELTMSVAGLFEHGQHGTVETPQTAPCMTSEGIAIGHISDRVEGRGPHQPMRRYGLNADYLALVMPKGGEVRTGVRAGAIPLSRGVYFDGFLVGVIMPTIVTENALTAAGWTDSNGKI